MSVVAASEEVPEAKRPRVDESSGDVGSNGDNSADPHRFDGFTVDRVLNDRARDKVMVVSGKFGGSDDTAVVVLEKTPFTKDSASKILAADTKTSLNFHNDIYSTFQCSPPAPVNEITARLVYPATQKHIDKHTEQDVFFINETPEDYKLITLPYIEENQLSVKWVHNILEKKKEADRIIFEDDDPENGFILLPDMKWDGLQLEDLYLTVIIHNRDIRSIRDLNQTHLPLLHNIKDKATAALNEKYSVPVNKLRMYFHYQPSYYHLHVHITHVKFDAPGSSIGRAVGFQDVINNITIDTDYYKKATLVYTVGENTGLCKKYKEANKL